jgi:hypothetical protein
VSASTSASPLAYSIREFCKLAGFSHMTFYKMPVDQRPPVRMVGRRRLILASDATAWLSRLPIADAVQPTPRRHLSPDAFDRAFAA